jgi:hypothetical protein
MPIAIDYFDVLVKAISEIRNSFLRTPTIAEPIEGERVFCYELYHQLRLLLGDDLDIAGKTIKKKEIFDSLTSNQIPDLIIHSQGNLERQDMVVEVKTNSSTIKNKDKVFNDLKKLYDYLNGPLNDPNNIYQH